jgi:tripartite-type tricarboxylate transporter receptor subunit TctC
VSGKFMLLALALFCAGAHAQQYPAKTIRILLSGGAGGPNDVQSRGVAQWLQQAFGQPVVVDNRPGAQGQIALEACAKAAPDGYTLCTGATNNITYQPVLKLSLPYEPLRDFTPVAHLGATEAIIVVHSSVRASSLDELVAQAKAKPGALAWATFGPNTSSFYFMEWLRRARGAEFLHVPYKSSPQSQQAVVAGEVQANLYSAGQAAPLIKAGKLKGILIIADTRVPYLPDVPVTRELGIDLPLRTWYGLFGPTGMPKDITTRLNAEVNRALTSAQFVEKMMAPVGISPTNVGSSEDLAVYMKRDREAFLQLAKLIGLKPEP